MKSIVALLNKIFCACVLALILPVISASGQEVQYNTAFSPNQGATELVVNTVNAAQKSVLVAAYTFTSPSIADSLIAAHGRGVDVKVVLDFKASHQKSSLVSALQSAGISLRLDNRHAITHDKIMIVDGSTVETGSFNYTKAAEKRNAENVIVLHDPKVAADYTAAWQKLWDESKNDN